MRGFHEALQVRKSGSPEDAIAAEPRIDRLKRARTQLEKSLPADAMGSHQAGALQQSQVLRNGRSRDRERLSNSPCR